MKEPILARTLLFSSIGGRKTGVTKTSYRLDWNLVETSLGAMLEPRSITMVNPESVSALDTHDEGFTNIMEYNEDRMQDQFNTGGGLFFRTFSAN